MLPFFQQQNYEEWEWMREKVFLWKHVQIVQPVSIAKGAMQEYNVLLLINSFIKYLLHICHVSGDDVSG